MRNNMPKSWTIAINPHQNPTSWLLAIKEVPSLIPSLWSHHYDPISLIPSAWSHQTGPITRNHQIGTITRYYHISNHQTVTIFSHSTPNQLLKPSWFGLLFIRSVHTFTWSVHNHPQTYIRRGQYHPSPSSPSPDTISQSNYQVLILVRILSLITIKSSTQLPWFTALVSMSDDSMLLLCNFINILLLVLMLI
jgi:hypothetical protein